MQFLQDYTKYCKMSVKYIINTNFIILLILNT